MVRVICGEGIATAGNDRVGARRGGIAPGIVSVLVALAMMPGTAAGAELIRGTDGIVLDAASKPGAAPLLIRLSPDETVELFGHKLATDAGVQVYLTRGNDYQKWAFVAGSATLDGRAMIPGDLAVVSLASGRVDRWQFDAARLAAASPPGIAAQLDAALQSLAARQRQQRFWGRLGPVGAGPSPTAAVAEGIRRDYLAQDIVVALREGAAHNPAGLQQQVADRFAAAISSGDIGTTASLLDPAPFVTGGTGWLAIRRAFAETLVARLRGAVSGSQPTTGRAGVVVQIAGRPYALQFNARDGFPFVSAVEAAR